MGRFIAYVCRGHGCGVKESSYPWLRSRADLIYVRSPRRRPFTEYSLRTPRRVFLIFSQVGPRKKKSFRTRNQRNSGMDDELSDKLGPIKISILSMKYITRHAGLCNRENREYPSSQVRKQISNNEAEKDSSRLTEPLAGDSLKLFGLMGFVTLAMLVRRFVTLMRCVILGIVTLPSLVLFFVFLVLVAFLVLRSACLRLFFARRGRTLHALSLFATDIRALANLQSSLSGVRRINGL